MFDRIFDLWWIPVLRGVLAILFGILALFWPGITILALVIVFGAYAIVDGVFALIAAFRGPTEEHRVGMAAVGVLGILAGVVALLWPGITALALLLVIAAWFVATGVFEIIAGVRLRKEIENEWLPILSGVVSVIFGILLLAWPAGGALAIAWLIGLSAIAYGITLIALGLRLRKTRTHLRSMPVSP